jgi:phage terminase Nu1 subunit (DNA packaging protein)
MSSSKEKELFVPEASRLAGVSGRTLRRLLEKGVIAGHHRGMNQRWVIDRRSFEQWQAQHSASKGAP